MRKEGLNAEFNDEGVHTDSNMKEATYFLLNTNMAHSVADHQFMIEKGVAAAFEEGYIQKIEKIREGDTVFLYESGVGIVAHGLATGNRPVEEPVKRKGSSEAVYFLEVHQARNSSGREQLCSFRRRIDSSKPTYHQDQCCKNGSDHRFRFPSGPRLQRIG